MIEQWRDIKNYEGLYQVSNYGNVRSVDRYVERGDSRVFVKGVLMKPHEIKGGYIRAHLSKWNKTKFILVHRLVAEAFLPNVENFPQINHKDCNPKNNTVTNLEWCTAKYNVHYAGRVKKVAKKLINGIRCKKVARCDLEGNVLEIFPSVAEAHRRNSSFLPSKIYMRLHGKSLTHRKFTWIYYETDK